MNDISTLFYLGVWLIFTMNVGLKNCNHAWNVRFHVSIHTELGFWRSLSSQCCHGAINQIVGAKTSKHKTAFLMGKRMLQGQTMQMGHRLFMFFFICDKSAKKIQESEELSRYHDHIHQE